VRQFVLVLRRHFPTGYRPEPGIAVDHPGKDRHTGCRRQGLHEVQAGQSFWSIAIAYQITIRDLEVWNNLSRNIPLQAGQRLFVPGKDTEGYATPTPFGMIVPAAPDADGKIVHEVQPIRR
jgi:hypothetical protein